MPDSTTSQRIYRLDKFIVPTTAREEFLARVKATHQILNEQPGFIQDFLLEQPHDDKSFVLATLVEWENSSFIDSARAVVKEMHQKTGFNAQETIARLGIKAELGTYQRIR
ncbi:antibiotic biosynthesis monooxygenase family protein [Cellvibrio mixtus]|uniref:antibiotic biosynthesis monooxygenase family protein n=1 Tax=Cellvibrio mixtus TaxID=39650 RepID=UPI000586B2A6|nr:antibiotic biosynthesis monooxygenase [Cellvibrio mixtus]